ncbi:hypothetical protein [Benzoatithermus flavus]|uniref:Uncharacterized protein n=1 Tax=Benzoatithermus flavus TaxID=3108223 RepID=A0ABU8XU22_9PROT
MSDPILARLQALLEEARREAYERGYADAIKRVLSVAAELPPHARTFGELPQALAPSTAASAAPRENGAAGRRSRAPRGSVERRVLTLLQSAPAGLTVPEIENLASANDEPIKAASIRVTLQRLLAGGQVEHVGRRWLVRSTVGEMAVAAPSADGDLQTEADETEEKAMEQAAD